MAIISKSKDRFQFFKSLKFHFFLLFILIGIVPCLVIEKGIIGKYEENAVSVRTMDVRTQCDLIAARIGGSDYLSDASDEVINGQITQLANFYDGRILVIDQYCRIVQDTYDMSVGKTMVTEEVIQCLKSGGSSHVHKEERYIDLAVPIVCMVKTGPGENAPETAQTSGVILANISTDSIYSNMELLAQKNVVMRTVIIVVVLVLAFVLARLVVLPFNRITEQIGRRYDGYGQEEIEVRGYLEAQQIADAFNKTISKMKVLDDSRQEFVSNVSHELKTPITSMKVLADSLLMQQDAPVEIYQEFMKDITAEIDRESKIIDDLLSLVKMDKTASDLHIVPVNINELLELILKRLQPIAKTRNIEMVLVCERQVVADADEVKLTLALSNFMENAIKYNKENGWVHVTLDADHKNFTVVVEDSGIGIPEEDYEHIFERFYRVDKSHSREIGGTGLGLAIARSAILMHRGSVSVESVIGEGTKFTITVPLIHIIGQP